MPRAPAKYSSIVDRLFGGSRLLPLAREAFQLVGPRGQAMEVRDNHLMTQIMSYALSADSNCVDVGSLHGDILKQFYRFAPRGRHFAFEPIPQLGAKLRSEFPQAEVVEAALSDTTGTVPFHYVVTNPGYSGLRRRRYDRPGEQVEVIMVQAARLDDVLPPGVPIRLLKVDVEGAELQVFRGALRTLKSHRPYVIFEHGLGSSEYYGTTPRMVYDLLVRECGLRIFGLDGSGPMSEEELASVYRANSAWNFLAHP